MGRILPSDPCLIPYSAIIPISITLLVIVAMVIASLFICRLCNNGGKSYRDTSSTEISHPPPTTNTPNPQTSLQIQTASTQTITNNETRLVTTNLGIRISEKQTTATNPGIKIPEKQTASPNPEIKIPENQSASPNSGIKIPEKHIASPNPGIRIPEKQTGAANPGIRIPEKEGNEWYMVKKITPGERNRIPSFDEEEPTVLDRNGNPFRAYRTRTPRSMSFSRSVSLGSVHDVGA